MATSQPTNESYLVIGGCGFLGRHIVQQLIGRGETQVAVFDLVQRHFDDNVSFYTGDISYPDDVAEALTKSKATVVIHTASPVHGQGKELYQKVNVVGTQTVIEACIAHSVTKLVYTSSAGVVYNGTQNIVDVDERMSIPTEPLDAYNETKAEAEKLVLEANGKDGLLTCALRPAGIFGEGDRQLLVGLKQVMENGQTKYQIGDNENLFDWTYVGNVAHAHLLAADKLTRVVSPYEFTFPLPSNDKSTGDHRIPTSRARPLGPVTDPTPEEKQSAKRFTVPIKLNDETEPDLRPVLRTKMDQFAKATDAEYAANQDREAAVTALTEKANQEATTDAQGNNLVTAPIGSTHVDPSLRVAGQAYFITNCEPLYFWDFHRSIWSLGMNHIAPSIWKMPPSIGLLLASAAEVYAKFTGKEAGFTRFRVKFATQKRFYNVERAQRLLGYTPIWGVEEALQKTLKVSVCVFPMNTTDNTDSCSQQWFNEEEANKAQVHKN